MGRLETLCCGCPYVRKGRSGGDIDRAACGLEARKNEKRSDRVEWEHVVPASWMGEGRACWIEGDSLCVKKDGKTFKGRKCCLKPGVDRGFVATDNDLHNLFPAGGEVNGDRLNHPFAAEAGDVLDSFLPEVWVGALGPRKDFRGVRQLWLESHPR